MAEAKKQKLVQNPFRHVSLDESVLTKEEQEDLENNYEISCRTYDRLKLFGSSDSDSLPLYDDMENKRIEKKKHQIQLKLKSSKKQLATLSELVSFGPPSSWNRAALDVYKIFKVSTYIIDPNYMFCSSLDPQGYGYQKNTMNSLLKESRLPKWDSVNNKLAKFLQIYDGCEDLPDLLIERATESKAADVLTRFITNMDFTAMTNKNDPENERAMEMINEVRLFAKNFLVYLRKTGGGKGGSEKYVQLYITILLYNLFMVGLQLGPIILGKQSTSLDLPGGNFYSRDILTVPIEPDLQVRLRNKCCLVGEIKGCGCHGRDDWTENHKGHRVDLEKLPATSKGQVMENTSTSGTKQLSQEEVELLKMKYRNTAEIKPRVDASIKRKHMDALEGSSGDAGINRHECKMCGWKSQENAQIFQPYRDLDLVEEYKVSHFLPQLLAGMFACMQDDEIKLGTIQENVRFGISVVGFKLRFVRLVICRNDPSYRKPTVADIADQRVRCEVFLTQEINLFKKKHIKMFFQLLFGLTCVNSY